MISYSTQDYDHHSVWCGGAYAVLIYRELPRAFAAPRRGRSSAPVSELRRWFRFSIWGHLSYLCANVTLYHYITVLVNASAKHHRMLGLLRS